MKKETKKTIAIALGILLLFVILWIIMFLLMRHPKMKIYSSVTTSTFEKNMFDTYEKDKVTKETTDNYIKYTLPSKGEIYIYEENQKVSKALLVYDKDLFDKKQMKKEVSAFISMNVKDLEHKEEVLKSFLSFKEMEDGMFTTDITEGNIEFLARIDESKNKVVFYIYHLDNFTKGEK